MFVLAVSAPVRSQLLEESSNRLTKCAYLKHGPLNRAFTKLQLPFPGFNYEYRMGHQNIPSNPVSESGIKYFFHHG
jgi:hypothetical protein